MGWAEIRNKARQVVHSTFALPAIYTAPDGTETPCNVRMHNEMKKFGDLDREGFAKMIEDFNQLVFNGAEVNPSRGGTVTFPNYDITFEIINILPRSTDEFYRVEVTLP